MGLTPLWVLRALPLLGLTLVAGVAIDFSPEISWHDQQRIEQLILLLVTALTVASVCRKNLLISLASLPISCRWALSIAFLLGGVSTGFSAHPRFAWMEWATLLLLVGLVFLLGDQSRRSNARFDEWSIRLVVALALVIALKIMTAYLASMVVMGRLDSIMLFEGTFSNRRFFGQVASMLVPLLAYPLLRGGLSGRAQVALFALLAVWWMLVIVSGTRGTWAALLLASGVLVLWAWRVVWPWLKLQFAAFSLGALLFLVLFVWLPWFVGQDASIEGRLSNLSALNGRAELWTLAWAQIQAHPWLGIGPMHLAAVRNDFGAHPHNSVLQLAAEWGVPATLAFVLPAAAGMLRLLGRLRQNEAAPNVLLVCLVASLLAAGAQSMVDGVIVIPYTQTLLALVAGWALGVYLRDTPLTTVVPDSHMMRIAIPVLSILAFAALLYGVFPEVLNRAEVTQAYVDAGKLIPPRYWGVGWIP